MGSMDIDQNRHLSIREAPAKSDYDQGLNGLTLDDVTPTSALVSCQHVFTGTHTTPIVTPIYHSATYIMDKLDDAMQCFTDGGSIYSRNSNPTCEMTECAINALERGAGSLTFASGMAAVSSIFLGFLKTGDHVVFQSPCYVGTTTALKHMAEHYKVETTFVTDVKTESFEKAIQPNTKLIWVETPCNPNVLVVDIKAVVDLAKPKGILVGVDGTFASPYVQQPLRYGADFSMHSCSKYVGGHLDLIAGCVTTSTVEQWRVLKHMQGTFGNMLSPHDASLVLRGLRTLPLRMKKHCENGLLVAQFLDGHPKVERVHYPGLESHPQHEVAKKQMIGGFSAMIMAEIKGGSKGGATVAEVWTILVVKYRIKINVRIFKLAVSLGGAQSILEHPYTMTHGKYLLSEEETKKSGVTPGMLRISVGIEDADDLIADLKQALDKVDLS
ncbi:cystathionine gamma-lyase [Elysia marginata]|uniref:Cystathionine gamma-lyase n=1 Tax=Elysia marginata TaxID=1093978 RepID=A0AAV4H9H3_9GAST|nr:cystathionine gamma-lyase [Elysia marginata]